MEKKVRIAGGFTVGEVRYATHMVNNSEGKGRQLVGGYFTDGYDKYRQAKVCPYCGKEFKKRTKETRYEVYVKGKNKDKSQKIEFCTWTCKSKFIKENPNKLAQASLAKILGRTIVD